MEYISLTEKDELLVGLLSDTHLLKRGKLPEQIEAVFGGVDFILHAGDIYELEVLDELGHIAPVLAAEGDDDFFRYPDERVKEDHFLALGGLKLWLRHRLPFGLIQLLNSGTDDEVVELVSRHCAELPDVVVFGDTHNALIRRCGGILLVNPGSPTMPNYVNRLGTVALLTIASRKAEARLVQFE